MPRGLAWPCPEGGGGRGSLGGARQVPDSVTSLHMLHTNKTSTRVTSEAPWVEGHRATYVPYVRRRTALCQCRPSRKGSRDHDH